MDTPAQKFRLEQPDKYRRKLDLHNERKRLIKKGQWPKQIEKKNCTVCNNSFIPKSHNAKCCGDECKKINRKLNICSQIRKKPSLVNIFYFLERIINSKYLVTDEICL